MRKTREIPTSTKIRILFFTPIFSITGLSFIAVGLVFIFLSIGHINYNEFLFYGKTETTKGVVLSYSETNTYINDRQVFAFYYTYEIPTIGEQLEGCSYSDVANFSQGEDVTVEYLPNKPHISRISGTFLSEFFAGFVFIQFIILFIGLVLVGIGYPRGKRNLHIVRNGILTKGVLVDSRPTNVVINDRTVMQMFFEFIDNNGNKHTISTKTHKPEKLEDERFEQLLYLDEDPKKAVLVDSLPASIRKLLMKTE